MPKLTTGPNYLGRTDGRTHPNCRKTSFLKKGEKGTWGFSIPALIQIGDEKEIKRPNKCKGEVS